MKTLNLLLILLLFTCNLSIGLSQGSSCSSPDPFCTENGAAYPASVSTTAESGPDYGCLGSQPNPAWYYLEVAQPGTINIALTNSAAVVIDFICWGPFNSLGAACSNLTGGGLFDGCTLFGSYPCGNIVDCSFSTAANEEINITNATAGQIYMVLMPWLNI